MIVGFVASLVPLAILAGIVALVVRATRGGDSFDWGTAVRQFFQHLLGVGLAVVAGQGVSELLALALAGPGLVRADQGLAAPVAFTLVGVPLYVGVMWWLLRQVRTDEREREALAWAVHLGVVGIISLVVSMVAAHDLLEWAVADTGSWPDPLAQLVVWGGLWGWTRWLERTVGSSRWSSLHVLVGSAIGLATAATGLAMLVAAGIDAVTLAEQVVVTEEPARAMITLLVGGAAWAVYWFAQGRTLPHTGLWHGYVLLGGVLGGLAVAVVAGSSVLWMIAVWFLGDPASDNAVTHFADAASAAGALVAGGAVWGYHRVLLGARAERARTEIDRIHDLLLSGVGLIAAAVGIGAILMAVLETLVGPGTVESGTSPINTLLGAVTALVVGGPVWWLAWSRIQHIARSSPLGADPTAPAIGDAAMAERSSPTRRVYLFGLFGIGGLAAVISVLVMVIDVLEDVFTGQVGSETVYSVRTSVAVLVTSAAIAALHWRVYREDRSVVVEVPRSRPTRVTLVGVDDPDIVADLQAATDAKVELWARRNGTTPPWQVGEVMAALSDHDAAHVIVMSRPSGLEVIDLEK